MDEVAVDAIEFDAAPEKARRGNSNCITHIASSADVVSNSCRIGVLNQRETRCRQITDKEPPKKKCTRDSRYRYLESNWRLHTEQSNDAH
jgi:hypothetical protein